MTKKQTTKPKSRAVTKRVYKQRYTLDEKSAAGLEYALKGTLLGASKSTGIPETTLIHWKNSGIWDDLLVVYRDEKADEHMNAYSKIVDKAQAKAIEGLNNLDATNLSTSDIKGLVVTGATATDKGLLLAGKPTTIKGTNQDLKSLTKMFEDIAAEVQRNLKVVSEQ